MKPIKSTGFTLIELLVVVLIIGILASIALPQYQKAVERARMTEAMTAIDGITKAQSVLHMQTGRFANNLDALNAGGDIVVNAPSSTIWEISSMINSVIADGAHRGTGKTVWFTRQNGRYQGGKLGGAVYPDGLVRKSCINPPGNTEFCKMVEGAGYTCSIGGTGTACAH